MKRVARLSAILAIMLLSISACAPEPVVAESVLERVVHVSDGDYITLWKDVAADIPIMVEDIHNVYDLIYGTLNNGYSVPELNASASFCNIVNTNSYEYCIVSPDTIDYATEIAKVHLDLNNVDVIKHKHLYNSDTSMVLRIPASIKNITKMDIVTNHIARFSIGDIALLGDSVAFSGASGLIAVEKDAYSDDFNHIVLNTGASANGYFYYAIDPKCCEETEDGYKLGHNYSLKINFQDAFAGYPCTVFCGDFSRLLSIDKGDIKNEN